MMTKCYVLILLLGSAAASLAQQNTARTANTAPAAKGQNADPAQLFQHGQDALAQGRLDEAEKDFRKVLEIDPQAGSAYANLGVVYMRRKQWDRALQNFEKAERMMPQVAGIRLNIGLVYFRQNRFLEAIPPLESVVREQPDAVQPRYLLGLCYFFDERWNDATATLEPLWAQESAQLPYLYVLANAAHRAGRSDLDERAAAQLVKLGDGSPQYHLFVGKYHLNLGHYDEALAEFQAAAAADPNLPFVHFNLGLTHFKKQEYPQARDEFLKDAAVEPDLALNYEQLGDIYWLMDDDKNAEASYREALRRDPRLVDSRLGLAKIDQREKKYAAALTEADAAVKIDPDRADAHYMRGQLLLHLGRKAEANRELEAAAHGENENHDSTKPAASETLPSPELMQVPQ
jgi:tetratricopeptide (TPR) repeat protein